MAPPSVTLPKNVETDSNVRMAPSLTLQLQRFRVDNNTELRYLDLELTDVSMTSSFLR